MSCQWTEYSHFIYSTFWLIKLRKLIISLYFEFLFVNLYIMVLFHEEKNIYFYEKVDIYEIEKISFFWFTLCHWFGWFQAVFTALPVMQECKHQLAFI